MSRNSSTHLFGLSTVLLAITLIYQCWKPATSLSFDNKHSSEIVTTQSKPGELFCETPAYKARILSYYPLIIHLQDFITPRERAQILKLSVGQFNNSTTLHENGSYVLHPIRTSTSAYLEDYDPVVSCLSKRVSEFQGYHPELDMEQFQVTRYKKNQFYGEHFDWFSPEATPHTDGTNRLTTLFGIIEAECENCGTKFPGVQIDWKQEDQKWCNLVDCEAEQLIVKPVPGSMLFWRNLLPDGKGDPRTLHAGMPLTNGIKVGLNIWSMTPGAQPDSYARNPVLDEATGSIITEPVQ